MALGVVARLQVINVGGLEGEKCGLAARNQGRSDEEQAQYDQSDDGVDVKSSEKMRTRSALKNGKQSYERVRVGCFQNLMIYNSGCKNRKIIPYGIIIRRKFHKEDEGLFYYDY